MEGGLYGFIQSMGSLVAISLALLCGTLLALGKKVPPLFATFGLLLPIAAGWIGELHGMRLIDDIVQHQEVSTAAHAKGISNVLLLRGLVGLTVLIPGAILVLSAAIGGLRRKPYRVRTAMAAIVVTVALVAVPLLMAGQWPEAATSSYLRAATYLVLGLLTAVAFLANEKAGNGPECAAIAGVALATVICAGELMETGISLVLYFDAIAQGAGERSSALFQSIAERRPWGWAALFLGFVYPVLAMFKFQRGAGRGFLTAIAWLVPLVPLAWFATRLPTFP